MTTKEHAAALRATFKRHGWTSRDISVKIDTYSMGSSIDVRVKRMGIPFDVVERIAKGAESVRRCEYSGEILSGGNRYVSVSYTHEAADAIQDHYKAALTAAADALKADPSDNSLHPIAGTDGFLLGRGDHGNGFSLWKEGHITQAYDVLHLATPLYVRLTRGL